MQANTFIIDAWDFSKEKARKIADDGEFRENCWYHCQRTDSHLPVWLEAVGIEPALIQAVIEGDTRPRFQQLGEHGFFLILRGVNLNQGAEPDDMLTLGFLFHRGSLITFRRRQFKAVLGIRQALEQGGGPSSVADVVVSVLEKIHERVSDVLELTDEFIDGVENNIEALSKEQQRELTMMHRRLLKLSRFLKPQTGALDRLEQCPLPMLQPHKQRLLNEKNTAQAISESITSHLDHIWILREHMQQALAEVMSRNTYWLSVVAGVFLPLGFLTGLFGINIAGMPGTEDPAAFAWFCLALALLGLVEFLLFRRLKFL